MHYRHFILMNMRRNILIKSHKLNLGPQSIKENKIENSKGKNTTPK
jgi:phage antirepressor YoqD-like protein